MKMTRQEAGRLGAKVTNDLLWGNHQQQYEDNPKKCKECNKSLPYEKRFNKFCSHSCSISHSNRRRKIDKKCLCCQKPLNKGKKYCSVSCQVLHQKQEKIALLKSGVNVDFSEKVIRQLLLEIYDYTCQSCKLSKWLNQQIPLEVHHIDGDHKNNRFKNLNLLCPNCHALTDNYKSKNTSSTRLYRKKH